MIRNAFAGGNTPYGFYSYYDNILDTSNKGRLIILKGGPGVGKSSLIKNVGKALTELNKEIEYFICSGDNTSYDGIYCPYINTAIIDGTAPHIVDPVLPGITDEIVNLGVFINGEGVKENKEKILNNNMKKSRYFKIAYSYFASAANLDNIEKDLFLNALVDNVIFKEAENFINTFSPLGCVGRDRKLFLRAITPEGSIDFLNERVKENKIANIKCYSGNEVNIFLSLIVPRLTALGYQIESYFNPMRPLEREFILIKELNTIIGAVSGYTDIFKEEKKIEKENENLTYIHENGIDYIAKEKESNYYHEIDLLAAIEIEKVLPFKDILDCNKLLMSRLIRKAYEQLKNAQLIHKDSEKYYIMNMDWNGITKLTEELITEIIKTNNL